MKLTKIQMESIDKIILFLKTDIDLRSICNQFILSDHSKVKILNILAHMFNIIPNNEILEYRIYKGSYKLVKHSREHHKITEYNEINICYICDLLIDKSYEDIYEIIYSSFK